MTGKKNSLALRIAVPDLAQESGTVEVRPLVDGTDILAEAFTQGPGGDPRWLLPPDGPLTAGAEPHEVQLAEAVCTEGCCGALYVTIRHDGDDIVWDGWRNPDDDDVELPEFRFDARAYAAEVARATADLSWEWPARTVARLLDRNLQARADWLDRWECELGGVFAWLSTPGQVNLVLFHPGRSAIGEGRPWLQFRKRLDVSAEDPERQAARLAEELVAGDPRTSAELCGGSREYAEQLGYAWPRRPGRRRSR